MTSHPSRADFPFIVLTRTFDLIEERGREQRRPLKTFTILDEIRDAMEADMRGSDKSGTCKQLEKLYDIGYPVDLAVIVFSAVLAKALNALEGSK